MEALPGWGSRAVWPLVVVAGCFSPSFDDGQFTCPTGDCPPGLACVDGLCTSDPTAPAIDAATVDAPAVPDAAAPVDAPPSPDARPPQPARIYTYSTDTGTWNHVLATLYFSGTNAPDPTRVQTAWAHCRTGSTICVGTDAEWKCTADGASWFGGPWTSLHALLGEAAPTYSTAWDDTGDFLKDAVFNSAEKWWQFNYVGRPRDDGGGIGLWNLMLVDWYGAAGSVDRDAQWDGDPNAPPSAAALVADFRDGTDWVLWDGSGTEYRRGAAGWVAPVPAPFLAVDGAPPADLVVAAATCRTELLVLARGD